MMSFIRSQTRRIASIMALLAHGDDVAHVLLDDGEVHVAQEGAEAIGDRRRAGGRENAPRAQGARGIVHRRRLRTDHARGGRLARDCQCRPGQQPAAAHRGHHDVQIGDLLHQLQRRRPLPRDDVRVIGGVDEVRAGLR